MSPEQKRATSMTIAACPEGGFMVYSLAEEHRGFVENRPMVPIAGFADLQPALDFIETKMGGLTAAPSTSGSLEAALVTSTIEWHKPDMQPRHMIRLLIAIENDCMQTNKAGHFNLDKCAWCLSDGQVIPTEHVQAWAFMPTFPFWFVRGQETSR
jgi:hypothetical protein